MKISAASFSFAEVASPAASAKDTSDFGSIFETAVRDAAKESKVQPKAHRGKGETHQESAAADGAKVADGKAGGEPAAVKPAETAGGKLKASVAARDGHDKAKKADDADTDATDATTAKGDAERSSAVDFLGRLLGGELAAATTLRAPARETHGQTADAAKTAVAEAVDAAKAALGAVVDDGAAMPDTVLEGRIVVVSLTPGATAPDGADGAGKARGKVQLEVLHMETHFEPRSDAVVLVEGKAAADAVGKTAARAPGIRLDDGEAPGKTSSSSSDASSKLRLSFDEALARLGQDRGGASGNGSGSGSNSGQDDHRVAREDRAAAALTRAANRAGQVESDKVAARPAAAAIAKSDDDNKAGLVLPLASMTDQVAGRIVDALGASTAGSQASDRPTGESYLRMTAGGAALKTLTIQLQPENLGRLDVSMRLVDGQLTLELAATEASTAKVLAEDREGLRKLLQHAGFTLDDASITIVTRDASTLSQLRADASANAAGAGQDGGSAKGFGGGAQSGGQAGGERGDAAGQGSRGQEQGRGRSPEPGRQAPPRSASTYI